MSDENEIKKVKLDWNEHYKETPMEKLHWYADELDPEVPPSLAKYCPECSTVLDLGTGPGTAAIEFTKLGFSVTATDISQAAIDMAKERADNFADKIDFIVDDIRDSIIEDKFDIIHDRGCFHVLDKAGIDQYLDHVPSLLNENGILLLKTFSTREVDQQGPNRYNTGLIEDIFSDVFKIIYSEETVYPSTLPVDPKALFCVLTHV